MGYTIIVSIYYSQQHTPNICEEQFSYSFWCTYPTILLLLNIENQSNILIRLLIGFSIFGFNDLWDFSLRTRRIWVLFLTSKNIPVSYVLPVYFVPSRQHYELLRKMWVRLFWFVKVVFEFQISHLSKSWKPFTSLPVLIFCVIAVNFLSNCLRKNKFSLRAIIVFLLDIMFSSKGILHFTFDELWLVRSYQLRMKVIIFEA